MRADQETGIREVFRHALEVRALGAEARTLADRFFFETLVRVHREGEGAPYTGLKAAGTPVEPAVAASDAALETGSVEPLARLLASAVETGLHERWHRVVEAKEHASESVDKGRQYVAAYVDFVHYAERVHVDAAGAAAGDGHEPPPPHRHQLD